MAAEDMLEIPENGTPAHGHVDAVMAALKKLQMANLLSSRPSPERNIVTPGRRIKQDFKIDRFVLVGDRGMTSQKQIDQFKEIGGIEWIGALRPSVIKQEPFQLGLFDECNLFELTHPDSKRISKGNGGNPEVFVGS